MYKNLFTALAIYLCSSFVAATDSVPVEEFFDESFGDLPEEISLAQEDGKKGLLIMFEMAECPFCHWMKQKVLNKKNVQDFYRQHFRIITIDTEGDLELVDLSGNDTTQKDFSLKQFRVRATPVFQFIGTDGKPIRGARLTGKAKNAEEFLLFGEFVVNGHSTKMAFSKYKRLQRAKAKN